MGEKTTNVDELVSYLIGSLVDHADGISIQKRSAGRVTTYEVTVHPDDVGKVIGRQGRIIKAIRTLVRAAASVEGGDATVEVLG